MHVQRALGRALDQAAHLPLYAPVAVRVDQLHVAEAGVGVQADRHRRAARAEHGGAALGDVGDGLGGAAARLRAHLDLGEERLVPGALERRRSMRGTHPVGHVVELERLGVHQQQLLLHADRELPAAAEAVVHGPSPSAARAAMRPNTSAPASPLA